MRINDMVARTAAGMPHSLQRRLRGAYRYISPSFPFGKIFRETYDLLQESQWWSRERLEEYQVRQLGMLLRHAYDNVPYYRRVFDERGLKPGDIQSMDDLKLLPCLTKDGFRENFRELLCEKAKVRFLPWEKTSGTSGKPLQFHTDDAVRQKELAFVFHHWSRVGYRPEDKRVEMRGRLIPGNKPVEYDAVANALRLSPRIEDVETTKFYIEKIAGFGAEYLHGYPSAVADLAYHVKKHGLAVPFRLKAVLLASGPVFDWARELVGEVFGCRVFCFYGMVEHVVTAGECEHSAAYHCSPQYGITEIDPETREIMGTGFLNRVNPFIRYRTTDIASGVEATCGRCGRDYYPVIGGVEGRLADYIITSRGLFGPSVFTYPFKGMKNVRESQIIQEDLDRILVRIVPLEEIEGPDGLDETDLLRRELQRALGDGVRIDIEYVERIELTASGKFQWIVSEVFRDLLEKDYPAAGQT